METHILHFNSFESGKQTLTDDKTEEGAQRRSPAKQPVPSLCSACGALMKCWMVPGGDQMVTRTLSWWRQPCDHEALRLVVTDRTSQRGFVSEVRCHGRDFCLCFLCFITCSHYGDFSFECKTNTWRTDLPVLFIFDAFFHYLKCHTWHSSHRTHLCVQHLSKCVLHGFFSCMFMALYCTVQLLLYIFNSFYLKCLGNASLEHVYTNASHVSLIISAGFKLLRLVIQWCVHNASSISSCCWPLFRCYLSPLCSFMLFPVRQMGRKWDEKLVWSSEVRCEHVPGSAAGLCLQTSTDRVSLCKALSFYLNQRSVQVWLHAKN